MASYKRRREDDDTFGFGRYPKRSKRDHNDANRSYHSMSVNRIHSDRQGSKLNGLTSCDQKLYHFSLSSELFARHSNSYGQRFSTCSNGVGNSHYSKHQRVYKRFEETNLKKSKLSKDQSVSKQSCAHSRVR